MTAVTDLATRQVEALERIADVLGIISDRLDWIDTHISEER